MLEKTMWGSLQGKCTPIFSTKGGTLPAFLSHGKGEETLDAEEVMGLGPVLITLLIAAAQCLARGGRRNQFLWDHS